VPLPRVASGRLGRSRVGCDRNQPFRLDASHSRPKGEQLESSPRGFCQRGELAPRIATNEKSHYARWRLFVKPATHATRRTSVIPPSMNDPLVIHPTPAFQPRRLIIAPDTDSCKRSLDGLKVILREEVSVQCV
jgi:hypothetical protein